MKKRYVLKKWVKEVLSIMLIIGMITIFYLTVRVTPKQKEAITRCYNNGMSYESCRKGILGY